MYACPSQYLQLYLCSQNMWGASRLVAAAAVAAGALMFGLLGNQMRSQSPTPATQQVCACTAQSVPNQLVFADTTHIHLMALEQICCAHYVHRRKSMQICFFNLNSNSHLLFHSHARQLLVCACTGCKIEKHCLGQS